MYRISLVPVAIGLVVSATIAMALNVITPDDAVKVLFFQGVALMAVSAMNWVGQVIRGEISI